MARNMVTMELARLFENQGFYQDALDIYKKLDDEESSNQTQTGIERMQMRLEIESDGSLDNSENSEASDERIAGLLEKWLDLIVLQHRLRKFKKIKSRLI